MNKPTNYNKESMDINEEFLNLFMDDISKKKHKKSKKNKSKKKKSKRTNNEQQIELNRDTFKDDIMVFIEQIEIVDIKKLLNIIDKLKKNV